MILGEGDGGSVISNQLSVVSCQLSVVEEACLVGKR
jgi:hypothetical protein